MLHGARELPLHSTAPSIHVVQLGRVASHSLRRGKAFGRMAALVVNDQHDRLETDQLPHSQWTQRQTIIIILCSCKTRPLFPG